MTLEKMVDLSGEEAHELSSAFAVLWWVSKCNLWLSLKTSFHSSDLEFRRACMSE